jgi:putative oxidoreductase
MEIALLILRIGVGLLFAAHGAQKLFGWFGGGGIEATGAVFESIGLRPGRHHAAAGGLGELLGGLLLAAGLLSSLAAALIIATMTAAALTVNIKNGPWSYDNGWEVNLLYALAGFAVAGAGAGELSLDHGFGLEVAGMGWALGALAAGVLGGAGAVGLGRLAPASDAPPAVGA